MAIISHQPFHQKYRPQKLDQLIGQEIISLTLKQALLSQKIAPAYLFNGPRGTGKTSTARIFAKSLNCVKSDKPTSNPCNNCDLCKGINNGTALDIIEIDAASNTGVENIRDLIERANFAPTQAKWKVYVIDECHMLSAAASNALLKTIEEPPQRVVFILATTNPERVLKTIQSRCQKFDFKRINTEQIYKHLLDIAQKESIEYEDSAIKLIAKRANGGMRDAASLLDQLSLLPNGIKRKNVEQLLGEVSENDLIKLIYALINNDPILLIKNCCNLYDAGNEPILILEGLLNITRDLLLTTINSQYSNLFYTSKEFQPELNKISQSINKSKIIHWHNALKNLEYQIKNSGQPRLWLEIHLTSLITLEKEEQKSNHTKKQVLDNVVIPIIKNEINFKKENSCLPPKKDSFENEEQDTDSVKKIEHENLQEQEKINLKEKWSLILSKLELPSTKMLLSQQAELLNIQSNNIEIGLSPNWENMIKSRKVILENAVRKIFGEQMNVIFVSRKVINQNTPIQDSVKRKEVLPKIKELKKSKIEDQPTDTEDVNIKNKMGGEISEEITKKDSKNLADFFSGEIIDIQE